MSDTSDYWHAASGSEDEDYERMKAEYFKLLGQTNIPPEDLEKPEPTVVPVTPTTPTQTNQPPPRPKKAPTPAQSDAPERPKSSHQQTQPKSSTTTPITQISQIPIPQPQIQSAPRYRWVPDEEVSECSSCSVSFGLTTRKHHCRYCGNIFCSACTSSKAPLPNEYRYDNPQRVCDHCAHALQLYWHSAMHNS